MRKNYFLRRITAFIAIFAMLVSAFMPAVSNAFIGSAKSNAPWAEICTSTNVRLINLNAAASDYVIDATKRVEIAKIAKSTSKNMHVEHCPFCCTHPASFVLPSTAQLTVPVISCEQSFPSLYYTSPAPLFIWATAQSRAPPCLA
jgi:hypothetical protein